jgi:hypothetical protein
LFVETRRPEARVGQKFCSFFATGGVGESSENQFPSYTEFSESDVAERLLSNFREYIADQDRPTNCWKQKRA